LTAGFWRKSGHAGEIIVRGKTVEKAGVLSWGQKQGERMAVLEWVGQRRKRKEGGRSTEGRADEYLLTINVTVMY